MSDLIKREDAVKTVIRKCSPICAWQIGTQQYPDCVVAEINTLPSADAVQEDNEIIKAINTIENFLEQGVFISTSMWRAKDGTVLKTDWGYFEDGLKEILDYVEHKGGDTE